MNTTPDISVQATDGAVFHPSVIGKTATAPRNRTRAQMCTSSTANKIEGLYPAVEIGAWADPLEYKRAYDDIHKEVIRASKSATDKNTAVIRALGKMRALLSQRGDKGLRKKAGIKMGWGQYFQWHKQKYSLKQSLRTVIYQIDALGGKKRTRRNRELPFWEDLIERLETLVPTVEDGNEHVIVEKLELATLRVRAGERADPKVVLLCQRIAANFTAYAKLLAPSMADYSDVLKAEVSNDRVKQLEQEPFCAEVV